MKKYKYVSKWEVEKVLDKLPKEEHERFIKKVIKKLKTKKALNSNSLFLQENWVNFGRASLATATGSGISLCFAKSPRDIFAAVAAGGAVITLACIGVFLIGGIVESDDDIIDRQAYEHQIENQLLYLNAQLEKITTNNYVNRK